MGTSSCGGRVEAREGKGKAQLRRPVASRPRRDYSGPPPPSAQKLKFRWVGCLRRPIIGASREKHPPPSPREGKADFSALTRCRAITPKKGINWAPTCGFARFPTREGGPKPSRSGMLRPQYGKGPGITPAPIMFSASMLSSVSAFPCIDTLQFVVALPCIGTLWLIVALPRTGASSHIGTSPAPPSGYTPMVPIRSSSDAVSIHQTPELSCVNVSSTWRSAASASRVTSRKIWPPCL